MPCQTSLESRLHDGPRCRAYSQLFITSFTTRLLTKRHPFKSRVEIKAALSRANLPNANAIRLQCSPAPASQGIPRLGTPSRANNAAFCPRAQPSSSQVVACLITAHRPRNRAVSEARIGGSRGSSPPADPRVWAPISRELATLPVYRRRSLASATEILFRVAASRSLPSLGQAKASRRS